MGCGHGVTGRLTPDFLLEPFALGFMRRALAGCLALSVAAPPLSVFLVLRRMSFMSDVLRHGVLPAGWLARRTGRREGSQFAGLYLRALALIAGRHSIGLTHILSGTALAVDGTALFGMASVATVTMPMLALIRRPLVLESPVLCSSRHHSGFATACDKSHFLNGGVA